MEGSILKELIDDPSLNLHPAIAVIFKFEKLYKQRQKEVLKTIKAGNRVIISTGTGSGETFGRYIGKISEIAKNIPRLKKPRSYTKEELLKVQNLDICSLFLGKSVFFA